MPRSGGSLRFLNRPSLLLLCLLQRGSLPPGPWVLGFNEVSSWCSVCTLSAHRFATCSFSVTNRRFMYWSAASSTRLNHVPDLSSLPASIVVFDFGRQVRRIACSAPYKSPREAKELMLFIPQRAKAYRDIGVQTWHYDSARSRKGDSMALERVRASGFPGLQGLTKRAVRIFPSGSKHPLEKASVCMGGKPSKLWCFVFVLLNRNMNQEPPLHITCVTQHHSKLSIRVLLTPSIQAMGPCCTPGGCKNQQLDGRSHVYNWSGDTIRTLRPRSLTGVEDQPGGGLVCGFDKYRGEEGEGPSRRPHACRRYAGKPPASAPRGRGVPEEVRNAPPTYDRSTSSAPNYPAKRTRFKRRSRRNAKEGFDEGQTDGGSLLVLHSLLYRTRSTIEVVTAPFFASTP